MTTTTFEDFQKYGRENMDLALKSFGSVSKGFQAIAVEVADYSKKSFEDNSALVEKLAGAKTLDKAIEVQSAFVKTSYETYLARMTKLGELYADIAKESYKPVETALSKAK
ncbi:phasin family protein [Chenggangzhangella methanolivorans]|uniref:Phasin family protein n=1 Tax=Chenggangzhangella methanolivorans TaxID=1437009 RepID=A0A9E6REI5_9HYPH|nr:phasin family protein [Chenggangzhangella methanolivorans]QZN99436.1 phasin family protein [Chenggangzhangella methanolivorans]